MRHSIFFHEYINAKAWHTIEQEVCIETSRLLAFFVNQKVNCVISYNETKPIKQTRQIYRRTHDENPLFRSFIVRWIQNFPKHADVEIQHRSERPPIQSDDERRVFNYFNRHLRTF